VSATSILKQQEQIIALSSTRECSLLTELHALRVETRSLQGLKKANEQQIQEAHQSLELQAKDVETERKRSQDLQERCDDLTGKLEKERKLKYVRLKLSSANFMFSSFHRFAFFSLLLTSPHLFDSPQPLNYKILFLSSIYNYNRMAIEREMKPKPVRKSEELPGGGLGSADAALLDMTLGMLRCSVCRDRFKEVCLTRCFHLFCRECVDEVVRNRSRKCPMCGDKFGDQDCRTVFFNSG